MTNVYVHPTAIVDKDIPMGSGTKIWQCSGKFRTVNIITNKLIALFHLKESKL